MEFDSKFGKILADLPGGSPEKIEGENANEIEEFKRHCDETDLLYGVGCVEHRRCIFTDAKERRVALNRWHWRFERRAFENLR